MKVTPEIKATVVASYKGGLSLTEVARKHGVSEDSIRNALIEKNVPRRTYKRAMKLYKERKKRNAPRP